MANFIQFAPLALLGFAICVVQCINTSAPFFDEGTNLSFEKCGIVHKKRSTSSPWIVYLRQAEQGCYGIAISDRTILARECNVTEDNKEITAYVGTCADERIFYLKKCVKNIIEVKPVKEISLNEDDPGNETILIFNSKTVLQRTKPICLYNRAKETTNLLARKRQISDHYMMLRRMRNDNLRLLAKNKNTKLMSCKRCLKDRSASMAEVQKELGLPSQGLICVKAAGNYKDYDLVNFYKGRYFLRGLEFHHPLFKENCNAFVDVLPFIEPITQLAKNLSVLPNIPAVKQTKPFNNDADNLSFANCGTKRSAGREERNSSEDNDVTPYIFSGYQAQQNGHPWHAKIVYTGPQGADICGGTLISRKAVLTAAHCMSGRDASSFEVSIGIYNNSSTIGYGIQTNKPIKLIPHPLYDGYPFNYDIGLMIFDEEFGVTNHVHPICLWNEDTDVDRVAGKFMATVVGFGFTNNFNASGSLLESKMPIKSHKECYLSDRKFFGKYLKPGDNFCAGYTNGTNVGKGDSGGGLAVEKDGRWFIRGVVSIGKKVSKNQTVPHSYSLFNDVANYMDWIVENTPDLSFQGSN